MKKPENVFKGGFLETYGRRDESSSSSEAVLSGRWKIVEREGTIALFREWEDESIDPPFATFHWLDHALLFAAVAPASTRPPDYDTAEEGDGVSLFCDGREEGRLRWDDAEIVDVLNVAAYLVRNPAASRPSSRSRRPFGPRSRRETPLSAHDEEATRGKTGAGVIAIEPAVAPGP